MHKRTGLSLACVFVIVLSCRSREGDPGTSSGNPSVDTGTFNKATLLRAFGECAYGTYKEFQTEAVALDAAAKSGDRAATQEAWKKAMVVWERAEVLKYGPAAMTGQPGGQDLRDPIYGWPLVGRCLVDQTLVSKAYEAASFPTTSLVSTRSLAVAEYLLFEPTATNGCPAENEINKNNTWAALGDAEILKRRMDYVRVIAADVVVRAQRLVDAWDPAKGNFVSEIANAGQSKTFTNQQLALNAVSDAMFYLDIEVKNMKVGQPAKLDESCPAPPCSGTVESPWAKRSKEHIRANIDGYEQLLHGCGPGGTGLGFDDLLNAVNAPHITTKLDGSVAQMRAALDALKEPSLEEDIERNPAGVRALYEALRGNATVMKTEMASVLNLELPKVVASDND
jgi:uncharacterized protein